MWVFTTSGFLSAVEHRDSSDLLMVRSRDRESLEAMLTGIELSGVSEAEEEVKDLSIYSVAYSDYPWRVVVSKATFAIYTTFEILNYLNYDNFKGALEETRGEVWHDAAMKVWSAMLSVEDVERGYGKV